MEGVEQPKERLKDLLYEAEIPLSKFFIDYAAINGVPLDDFVAEKKRTLIVLAIV